MALRRIWNLPNNTHCDLLPLISSQVPIEIQLKCRFLKFYRSLLESDNKLIRFVPRSSLSAVVLFVAPTSAVYKYYMSYVDQCCQNVRTYKI